MDSEGHTMTPDETAKRIVAPLRQNAGANLCDTAERKIAAAIREAGNEHAAKIVEVMVGQKPWTDHLWARAALAIAGRAVRRGRHLTGKEKLDNLMKAMAEP